MTTFKAGAFEVSVYEPYPCWVKITRNGKDIAQLHHKELADLQFVLERAKHEAMRKLGENHRDEML